MHASDCLSNNSSNNCRQHASEFAEFYRLQWYNSLFIILFLAVFISGTIGNSLVCLVIWRNRRMRNVTNVFIVNLAIADLLVLIIVLIPSMIQDIFRVWFLGDAGCKILSFSQRVSIIVSILTLIAISIERYYAICHPLKFNATPTRVLVIIAAIWVIAMAFSSPELFFAETSSTTDWVCGQKTLNVVYSYIFIIGFYIIPFIIMTGAYIKIARSLWVSHVEELSATGCRSQLGSEGVLSQLTQRRRAARMLIVVVVCFFLCYLLHNTFVLLIIHGDYQQWDVDDLMAVITAGHLLIYANSAANPIIYNFMCEKFRGAFLTVCRCCRHCKDPMTDDSRMTSWRSKRSTFHREDTAATDV